MKRGMGIVLAIIVSSSLSFAQNSLNSQISDGLPDCKTSGKIIAINNTEVLNWKLNSVDQFHSRGHVDGTILKIYPDKTGHHHIETLIGANSADTIEIIYNESFGPVPSSMKAGSHIEACGEYITAKLGHAASPDGALIHWVHKSPNVSHDSGFMVVDGTLCGWN